MTHMSYQLLQSCSEEGQPVVSLGPQGDIRTAGFNGHVVVMVTSHETELGLNQTTTIHVEVCQIVKEIIFILNKGASD